MKLIWTRAASVHRQEIRDRIKRDNPVAAKALNKLLREKANRLIDHPELGRPGRVPGTRELVAHPNYIIVYKVIGGEVRVLRVLHAAMAYPATDD